MIDLVFCGKKGRKVHRRTQLTIENHRSCIDIVCIADQLNVLAGLAVQDEIPKGGYYSGIGAFNYKSFCTASNTAISCYSDIDITCLSRIFQYFYTNATRLHGYIEILNSQQST